MGKPRLRGWSHAVGAVFAIVGAAALILASRQQPAKAVTIARDRDCHFVDITSFPCCLVG